MSEPVSVDSEGPKIRPELMEPERLYHCIYKDAVLLFFVDSQKFLNCYEIDEPSLVEKIRNGGDQNIENALKEYVKNAK